eukprot:384117-Rhodomonas_salina.1
MPGTDVADGATCYAYAHSDPAYAAGGVAGGGGGGRGGELALRRAQHRSAPILGCIAAVFGCSAAVFIGSAAVFGGSAAVDDRMSSICGGDTDLRPGGGRSG